LITSLLRVEALVVLATVAEVALVGYLNLQIFLYQTSLHLG
jgi:hypothetical protein